jgi:hypothetical protein
VAQVHCLDYRTTKMRLTVKSIFYFFSSQRLYYSRKWLLYIVRKASLVAGPETAMDASPGKGQLHRAERR